MPSPFRLIIVQPFTEGLKSPYKVMGMKIIDSMEELCLS